jgi:site-specific DNA-methyltransferase (adenine-specific)
VGLDLRNCDCMELMKEYPDKYFDLIISDPPYNVGASDGKFGGKALTPAKVYGESNGKHYANHDCVPDVKYFNEIKRVSKNQIVWGFNYYPEYFNHSGVVVWDKMKHPDTPLSDCELAWQSINKMVTIYRHQWTGALKGTENGKGQRIHPNQKPVALYKWLLKKYAKEGDKILDTHLGSGSIAIACHDYKFDLVASEIDKEYFDACMKRVSNHLAQTVLF